MSEKLEEMRAKLEEMKRCLERMEELLRRKYAGTGEAREDRRERRGEMGGRRSTETKEQRGG